MKPGPGLYISIIKPVIDKLIAVALLIVLSPIFVFLSLVLLITNKSNPFFFQIRPGRAERLFTLLKFKTMNDKKDLHGKLLPDKERITSFGKFIRKTSLDELPQLINVVKGDMSLIGPRPLLKEYLQLYSARQKERHSILPGITGWAQVNGRNAISWETRFEYDLWYVNNVSFMLDLKIIFLTIRKVFKSEGISQQGHVTMPFFKGSQDS